MISAPRPGTVMPNDRKPHVREPHVMGIQPPMRDDTPLQSSQTPVKVEVLSVEQATPNPARWGFHPSGISLEMMRVQVKLECGHHFDFPTARHATDWLEGANQAYDLRAKRYTVDCDKCGGCEKGLRLRADREAHTVGVRLPDGRLFFPVGGPIACKKPGT
jgi:hypothetical protein